MKFPGAKYGLKMACGENPKRVYAQRGARRRAWATSPAIAPRGSGPQDYRRKWDKWNADHKGDRAGARPRERDARRSAARQHPRPQPLLPRRRDGADDRHREGVRLPDPLVPSRCRGLQDRRPAREGRHRRVDLGRLGRLQDGSARRGARATWRSSTAPGRARSCTPTIRRARSA